MVFQTYSELLNYNDVPRKCVTRFIAESAGVLLVFMAFSIAILVDTMQSKDIISDISEKVEYISKNIK